MENSRLDNENFAVIDGENYTDSSPLLLHNGSPPPMTFPICSLLVAELLTLLALALVSLYAAFAISATSLLHWNLKVLYMCQTLAGGFHAVGRLYALGAFVFGLGANVAGGSFDRAGPALGMTLSLYITPMLIGERIAATLLFTRYERCANKPVMLFVAFAAVRSNSQG